MNAARISVLSLSWRLMYFKIKSQNLADEGTLILLLIEISLWMRILLQVVTEQFNL